jgi:hypothetical protein
VEKTFGVLAGMAARWETLTGQRTSSAEGPTHFNGFPVPVADTELIRRTPWPVWDLRPDQPRTGGEDLRRAGGDCGAVGDVGGTTHEQRRMPNPFQRVSRPSRRHRIGSTDALAGVGLAA